MRLLLDTHVLLWWLADDFLSPPAQQALSDVHSAVFVSAASAWEISIKKKLGKLVAPDDLVNQLAANGFNALPILVADGLLAGALPSYHRDPFDRMIIAQAMRESLTVVTRDSIFRSYKISCLDA